MRFQPGDRGGVARIHSACGTSESCRSGRENLCPDFQATGRAADSGYTELTAVSEAFAYPIPDDVPIRPDAEEYPLTDADGAILDLKEKRGRGGKVLRVSS